MGRFTDFYYCETMIRKMRYEKNEGIKKDENIYDQEMDLLSVSLNLAKTTGCTNSCDC